MHAILVGKDDKLHWSSVPDPVIGANDVLLEIHATALNRADLLQRAGQYPPPDGWPEWFGLEAAGIIRDMGQAAIEEGRWHVGDKVCALLGGGGYAEFVAVPSGMIMPLPQGISMIEAAAIPEAFGAAYLFLFVESQLQMGETLLMQAGASGLASVLIPMAKAFGARVITTVLTETLAASIAHLGADRIVDTSRECLATVMQEEMQAGHPVDIAIDCLGGESVGACFPHMNRGGRWVMIATLAGDDSKINLKSMYVRGIRLIGTTLRSRSPEEKKKILTDLVHHVWPLIENGKVRPTIHKVLPIQQAEEAHEIMRAGQNVGKIVLTVMT